MKSINLISAFLICANLFSAAPDHAAWNKLLQKNVSADGKVNYKGFISDQTALDQYLKTLSDTPIESDWSVNEQKAYLINAYNAFTVKLITIYYPVKSIKDIGPKTQIPFVNTTWDLKFIRYGKDSVDLNFIEHGMLRKNYNDPRIHFALVCASASCPILLNEAYAAEKLDKQLDQQAKVFLTDKFRNDISADAPKLSKLFDWYAMDFKTKKTTVIDFINKYSPVKIDKKAKVTYLEYSWNLNE
ncbi:MAG: DUF547 domain-containing protein [Crocinitomicaceae bacterium]|jgi:hypothetical protein|nr:DUF547 domain-containing protein [Crocinitomicaceae bacterium]